MQNINNSIKLKLEIDLQFWRTQVIMWTSIGLEETFKENTNH